MSQRIFKRADSPNWYVNLGNDAAGKPVYKSTGCRDRRAAEARARDLERDFRAGPAPDAASHAPTLSDALTRAIADRANRGRSEGTLHMHKVKAGHLLRLLGGATALPTIDARAVDSFTASRLEEGASRNTIQKELVTLRVCLTHARRRKEYPHEIDEVMPVGWSTGYRPRTRYLSAEEARALLADLCNDELAQRRQSMKERAARVAFIVATSARWGESERARREDIDTRAGVVRLRGTKTAGAERLVPILPTFAPLLALALQHGNASGRLFEPWGSVRGDLLRACERLRIPPVSPNDLRRTTATWLRHAGVEPHLIAAVLGHRDSRMVERVYGRISSEALGEQLRARMGSVAALPTTGTTATATDRKMRSGSR